METLASKLKQLRITNEMTLQDLSDKTGFSRVYILEVETGKKIPLSGYLISISSALTTSYDKLFRLAVISRMDQLAAFLDDDKWDQARKILLGD